MKPVKGYMRVAYMLDGLRRSTWIKMDTLINVSIVPGPTIAPREPAKKRKK